MGRTADEIRSYNAATLDDALDQIEHGLPKLYTFSKSEKNTVQTKLEIIKHSGASRNWYWDAAKNRIGIRPIIHTLLLFLRHQHDPADILRQSGLTSDLDYRLSDLQHEDVYDVLFDRNDMFVWNKKHQPETTPKNRQGKKYVTKDALSFLCGVKRGLGIFKDYAPEFDRLYFYIVARKVFDRICDVEGKNRLSESEAATTAKMLYRDTQDENCQTAQDVFGAAQKSLKQ